MIQPERAEAPSNKKWKPRNSNKPAPNQDVRGARAENHTVNTLYNKILMTAPQGQTDSESPAKPGHTNQSETTEGGCKDQSCQADSQKNPVLVQDIVETMMAELSKATDGEIKANSSALKQRVPAYAEQ